MTQTNFFNRRETLRLSYKEWLELKALSRVKNLSHSRTVAALLRRAFAELTPESLRSVPTRR